MRWLRMLMLVALLGTIWTNGVRADDELQLRGALQQRPSGVVGTWVVGGESFVANSQTDIDEEDGPLTIGGCTEVRYIMSGTQKLAVRISSEMSNECGGGGGGDDDTRNEVYGRIVQFPAALLGDWNIGGVIYRASNITSFEQEDGPFAVNTCVEVRYTTTTTGKLAQEIETEDDYKCATLPGGTTPQRQIFGRVTSFPAALLGTWVVSGTNYLADQATQFEQEDGRFFTGGCIDLAFDPANNRAIRISTTEAERCGADNEAQFYGLIRAFPANFIGVWQIGTQTVTSTSSTLLQQNDGAFAVGRCVEVEYRRTTSGLVATKIATEDMFRCATNTFTNIVVGTVNSLPAVQFGVWVVDNNPYEVRPTTTLQPTAGAFAAGSCVELRYLVQAAVNVATAVTSLPAARCTPATPTPINGLGKIYATLDLTPTTGVSSTWRIGGIGFTRTAQTTFDDSNTAIVPGVCVEASYALNDTLRTLRRVETKPLARCQNAAGGVEFRFYGIVSTFPANLAGAWNVGGVPFTATSTTLFDQPHGAFARGAFVEVRYAPQGGALVARRIATHVAADAARLQSSGTLDAQPADEDGTWVINGTSYRADPALDVTLTTLNRAAGTTVQLTAYQLADGTPVLRSLEGTQAATYRVLLPFVRR